MAVVIDRTFTSGVWTCVHVYSLIIATYFLRVLNFRSWSQPPIFFDRESFPNYSIDIVDIVMTK